MEIEKPRPGMGPRVAVGGTLALIAVGGFLLIPALPAFRKTTPEVPSVEATAPAGTSAADFHIKNGVPAAETIQANHPPRSPREIREALFEQAREVIAKDLGGVDLDAKEDLVRRMDEIDGFIAAGMGARHPLMISARRTSAANSTSWGSMTKFRHARKLRLISKRGWWSWKLPTPLMRNHCGRDGNANFRGMMPRKPFSSDPSMKAQARRRCAATCSYCSAWSSRSAGEAAVGIRNPGKALPGGGEDDEIAVMSCPHLAIFAVDFVLLV